MQYIKNDLGYDESLLGEYDYKYYRIHYGRGAGDIERIGKKYQWIALHHIYARMADNHKLKKYYGDELKDFESLWDENIRDFDPSFNWQKNKNIKSPEIKWFHFDKDDQFIKADSTKEEIEQWTKSVCEFFELHSERLSANSEKKEWVVFESHEEISFIKSILRNWVDSDKVGEQKIWEMSNAYFIKNCDWERLKEILTKKDLYNERFPECDRSGDIYQGEYPWALKIIKNELNSWKDLVLKTGITHIEEYEIPEFLYEFSEDDSIVIKENGKKISQRVIEDEEIACKVMPANSELSWTKGLDHSIDDIGHAISVPCVEIIEHFNLNANDATGYYFAPNGDIVCFDAYSINKDKGLVMRKDYLEKFLLEKDYTLIFTGTPNDNDLITYISENKHTNLAGKTTVLELAEVFRRCNLVISLDSGSTHLAWASKKPKIVSIFCCTPTGLYAPIGDSSKYVALSGHHACQPCHKRICPLKENPNKCTLYPSVDEVYHTVIKLLTSKEES